MNGSTTPSTTELQQFAEQEYDKLFTDEGHFLLVFCDTGSGSYNCGYAVGSQAKTIMDSEAVSVLADYLDRYYSSDMEDEEFFSTAFQKTGERIMTVTKSQTPTVIIVFVIAAAVVVVVFLLYRWREKARAEKRRRDKEMEDILQTPLDKFSDEDEAENLAKKYEKKDEK